MATATPRLGLVKPAGGEKVDVTVLNANSDKIDKWTGSILVNDNVMPADTDLYEGCLVTERTSGWQWLAVPNGTGGFKRKMINAPLSGGLFTNGFGVPNYVSGLPTPANNGADFDTNFSTKGGIVSASGLTLPDLTGFFTSVRWRIDCWANFGVNATGYRLLGWGNMNGSGNYASNGNVSTNGVSGTATILSGSFYWQGTVGGAQKINNLFRQNSGGALTVDSNIQVTLEIAGSKS